MFYVKRSDGAYASYDGMTLEAIVETLATMGLTGEVIDEAEFNAATVRNRP